ncbi:hypothetical protein Taro_028844 [Colocasia esculenta]|uniref:GDSL esterase/lipase n=1 Tax=Colocasia esculenta TaxID=4460 RepID=A0A843VCC3_COLES|nr:hypothetical protein [Colocasia esculenta]
MYAAKETSRLPHGGSRHPVPLLLFLLLSAQAGWAVSGGGPANITASAIFVFGDSTVDPGNNDYIDSLTKSNFPPYGRDFPGAVSTGRFSNGKLATDFVASDLGVKDMVPPYLDGSLSAEELMTGVSFASAASGFDPLTAQISGVIPISQQLIYFQEYLGRLDDMVGRERREDIIGRAVFVVSAGTNDFVLNYFALPFQRHKYSLQDYEDFLLQGLRELLQSLQGLGARRFAIVSLPPMGCLPLVITVNTLSSGLSERACIPEFEAVSREYNAKLQAFIASMQANVIYADIYTTALRLIHNPAQYGFEETAVGCCGTGLLEVAILCNPKSPICPDASKYVFWDSVHPTERTNSIVAGDLRPMVL